MRQTVAGTPTNHTLDLASGLTQVLADGTNAYLYGTGRIGQEQPGGWQYQVPDALGSVRQPADTSGAATLMQSYAPFGSTLSTVGSASTAFTFVGEQVDPTALIYLRARYLSLYLNQWIQPDPIVSDPYFPADWNRYAYVRNNPINHTDPSGARVDDESCQVLARQGDMACQGYLLEERAEWYEPEHLRSGTEKSPPPFVSWNPSVWVPPALVLDAGRSVPPGTNFSQEYICGCPGACGIGALAAIFRTRSPNLSANDVFTNADALEGVDPNVTNWWELEQIVEDRPGWNAVTRRPGTAESAHQFLRSALSGKRYPVAGVQINGSTGRIVDIGAGHWVVVSAVSREDQWARGEEWRWLRIMNPFDNENEYYPWGYFWSGMWLETLSTHRIVEVWWQREDFPNANLPE